MNKSIRTLVLSATATALVASGAISSPANAESQLVVTVSKTANLALAGETVTVSVTGIPSGNQPQLSQGVYVYQCASAVAFPRPDSTRCRSGMTESLWLRTAGDMGARVASEQNPLQLLKEFTIGANTFDCSITTCGIFVRRDHMGGSADLSLDTIIPISFVTPAPKATQKLPTIGSTVKVGKSFSFKKTTSANLPMVVTTSTSKNCRVAVKGTSFTVTGVKAGTCKLTLSQKGSSTANPLRATVKSIRVTS
jgi:hypothetical protein